MWCVVLLCSYVYFLYCLLKVDFNGCFVEVDVCIVMLVVGCFVEWFGVIVELCICEVVLYKIKD